VGLPATAPDWNPEARCGNGLHYVPLVQGTDSQWRDGPSCVSDALRYAHGDYALWVVRAEVGRYPDGAPVLDQPPTAVMIDGHKAKARTLTPLARCGKSAAGRAHAALSAWAHAQWQADTAAHRETDTRASLASLERRLAATETTLREWRRG
jgi:hypothetical protein